MHIIVYICQYSVVAVHVYCCDKEDSEVDMPVCMQNYTRFAVTRHNNRTVKGELLFGEIFFSRMRLVI